MTIGMRIAIVLVLVGGVADLVIYLTLGHTQTISHQMMLWGMESPLVIVAWFVVFGLLAYHFWNVKRKGKSRVS